MRTIFFLFFSKREDKKRKNNSSCPFYTENSSHDFHFKFSKYSLVNFFQDKFQREPILSLKSNKCGNHLSKMYVIPCTISVVVKYWEGCKLRSLNTFVNLTVRWIRVVMKNLNPHLKVILDITLYPRVSKSRCIRTCFIRCKICKNN